MVVQMENTVANAVALDAQVAAVADVDLVDLVEQVLLRRARRRPATARGPCPRPPARAGPVDSHSACQRELLVAQLDAGQAVGSVGCGSDRLTAMSM